MPLGVNLMSREGNSQTGHRMNETEDKSTIVKRQEISINYAMSHGQEIMS